MRVEYVTSTGLLRESVSEWICIEHDGWARQKAASWWSQRSLAPCPASVDEAVALAKAGALATCEAITVSVIAGEKWPKIVGYKLGARPEYSTPETGWSTFEEALEEQRRTTGAYDDDKPEEHPRVLEVIELFGGSTVQIDSSKAGHFDEEGRWVPPQAPKKLRALGDMNDLPW
jgi:hypothetical protein